MVSGFEQALLAILVAVLMAGMGASLTGEDFRRVGKTPRAVLVGLLSQYGWMPAIAYALATWLALPDEMAIGLVIVGCTPGGTTSNMFAYYARADVALSVTMTAVSTVVAIVAMPLLLWAYATRFTSATLAIPYGSVASTLLVMLVPVAIGMLVRARLPSAARLVERVGSYAGGLVIVLLVASGLIRNGSLLFETSPAMYGAAIGLSILGMTLGSFAARLVGLPIAQRRAIALETGIQNSPLAFAIILASFAPEQHVGILWIPLLYALFVLAVASVVTFGFRRRSHPVQSGSALNAREGA